jgi:hypothetical protein
MRVAERQTFRDDLIAVLNRHSQENGSDTPDYILAEFICACLCAFDDGTNKRERHYDRRGALPTIDLPRIE